MIDVIGAVLLLLALAMLFGSFKSLAECPLCHRIFCPALRRDDVTRCRVVREAAVATRQEKR